jgi:hypothetical protein
MSASSYWVTCRCTVRCKCAEKVSECGSMFDCQLHQIQRVESMAGNGTSKVKSPHRFDPPDCSWFNVLFNVFSGDAAFATGAGDGTRFHLTHWWEFSEGDAWANLPLAFGYFNCMARWWFGRRWLCLFSHCRFIRLNLFRLSFLSVAVGLSVAWSCAISGWCFGWLELNHRTALGPAKSPYNQNFFYGWPASGLEHFIN